MKTNNLKMETLLKTNLFDSFQKEQIKLGLEEGLDVSQYAKPEFEFMQMSQIRQGLANRIDVSSYAKSEYNWLQMKDMRFCLENNIPLPKKPTLIEKVVKKIKSKFEKPTYWFN